MVVLFHLICKVIKLGEWSSGMIPRLGLLPNIKFEEARGSIPRLPQLFFSLSLTIVFWYGSLLKPQYPRELNNVYYLIELNYKYFF